MIFEEEFPDLKDKIRKIKTYSHRDPYNVDFDRVILIEDIQKHCLDQKRVAKILKKYMKSPAVLFDDEGFKKELGLE